MAKGTQVCIGAISAGAARGSEELLKTFEKKVRRDRKLGRGIDDHVKTTKNKVRREGKSDESTQTK